MKRLRFIPLALSLMLAAVPLAAQAQQTTAPLPPVQSAASAAGTRLGRQQHRRGHPWMRSYRQVLTPGQRAQARALTQQYRQTHPRGSAPDPQGRRALRKQLLGLLSPAQRTQLRSRMQQARAQRRARSQQANPQSGGEVFPASSPQP